MDIYEELVMHYLCDGKPHIFLSPNFRLAGGWAFPDFVVLDFRANPKIVSVVEVTTSASPVSLLRKVEERKTQWFDKLKEQLQRNSVVDDAWIYKVEVFVREDAAKRFKERFTGQSDVDIHELDETTLRSWKWDWTERE